MLMPFRMFPKHRYPDLVTCGFWLTTECCAVMQPTKLMWTACSREVQRIWSSATRPTPFPIPARRRRS